jgi:hypothetical protein
MERPAVLPTCARSENIAGLVHRLEGELAPVLTVELTPGQKIYFEHHILI